jgi:hypothetical protein
LRRFRIPEIVLGALITLAMLAFGATIFVFNPKNNQAQYKTAKTTPQVSSEALTNERIADYNETLDWLTGGLVFSTVGLWIVTWLSGRRQSRDMEAALDHAERALATAERAFVFIDGFNVELTTAQDSELAGDYSALPPRYQRDPGLYITRFAAQPRWKNGGNTPTRQLTIQADWGMSRDGIPPREYTYRNQPAPFFLGPHAVESSPFFDIPSAPVLVDWANNPAGIEPIILIWGRADYRDVFDATHFVEWCYWLRFSRPRRDERMSAQFIQWGPHNHTG